MKIHIPKRKRGKPTQAQQEQYHQKLLQFCGNMMLIQSTLDFKISSRGWCYMLEEHGLLKSEFDKAQKLINECRKSGLLPLDICAEDSARTFTGVEQVDDTTPEEEAGSWINFLLEDVHKRYNAFSFWQDQEYYIQMLVEKIDLVNLFLPICKKYRIPIANTKGWADISQRADMMKRFMKWESEGKTPVLLYCGDHDPAGLIINYFLPNNIEDLSRAVGWAPTNLIVDRFGLNYDFIEENGLTWIDNLMTGSGKDLASPKHSDHSKPYVQKYISRYGPRKCEANALVVRSEAGRKLCHDSINKYISDQAPGLFDEDMRIERLEVKGEIDSQLTEMYRGAS